MKPCEVCGADNCDGCEECISLNNSNNYISDVNEVKFLKNKTFQFVLEYFSAIDLSSAKIYLSRAPPLS